MKIRKNILKGPEYQFVSIKDTVLAKNDGFLEFSCCPFCKIERNRDVISRGGSKSGDWCPVCGAKEITNEWHR